MNNRLLNEPVMLAAAIRAVILAAVSFGFNVTAEQTASLMVAVEAVLALITRSLVVPTQLAEHRVSMGGSPTVPLEK